MRSSLHALYTIIYCGVCRYLRSAWQLILPPLVSNILYFTIFGHIIGQHIGSIDGLSYIQFIAPGLILMTIITSSYNSTLGAIFYSKFCRNIEEVLVAPMPTSILLLGLITAGTLRGLLNGLLVTIIACFFVRLEFLHVGLMLLTAMLSAALFALAGFCNAIFAKKWDDIVVIPTFVITPITYLGGIFFALSSLPAVWQKIAAYNPLLYIINAFRYSVTGVSDVPITKALIILVIAVIALFSTNIYLLKTGIGMKT